MAEPRTPQRPFCSQITCLRTNTPPERSLSMDEDWLWWLPVSSAEAQGASGAHRVPRMAPAPCQAPNARFSRRRSTAPSRCTFWREVAGVGLQADSPASHRDALPAARRCRAEGNPPGLLLAAAASCSTPWPPRPCRQSRNASSTSLPNDTCGHAGGGYPKRGASGTAWDPGTGQLGSCSTGSEKFKRAIEPHDLFLGNGHNLRRAGYAQ